MSWKDLDIKLKAELIKLGVLSGIRDIKLIRLLYDGINTPTLVGDLSYNETNVRPLLGIERIVHDYGIPEEEVNKANDIIQLIENEISLEEINNQLPILFRLFNKGEYISNNPVVSNIKQYDAGGWFEDVKNVMKSMARTLVDKEARRAEIYDSNKYTFDLAYSEARRKGLRTFFWDNKYYNTDYSGEHHKKYEEDVKSGKAKAWEELYPNYTHPELRKAKQEELDTYGITNELTKNKTKKDEILVKIPARGYDVNEAISGIIGEYNNYNNYNNALKLREDIIKKYPLFKDFYFEVVPMLGDENSYGFKYNYKDVDDYRRKLKDELTRELFESFKSDMDNRYFMSYLGQFPNDEIHRDEYNMLLGYPIYYNNQDNIFRNINTPIISKYRTGKSPYYYSTKLIEESAPFISDKIKKYMNILRNFYNDYENFERQVSDNIHSKYDKNLIRINKEDYHDFESYIKAFDEAKEYNNNIYPKIYEEIDLSMREKFGKTILDYLDELYNKYMSNTDYYKNLGLYDYEGMIGIGSYKNIDKLSEEDLLLLAYNGLLNAEEIDLYKNIGNNLANSRTSDYYLYGLDAYNMPGKYNKYINKGLKILGIDNNPNKYNEEGIDDSGLRINSLPSLGTYTLSVPYGILSMPIKDLFFSTYDMFDVNPFGSGNDQPIILVGKPFEYYTRFYRNEPNIDSLYYNFTYKNGGHISNNPTLALVGKVKKYDEEGLKDSSIILDYIFNGPLKRKKENSIEYRQALFNNVDPRNGYPSPWTAVKYYNTVVDALNSGDTSKKWETDGSIGQETAAAGWAKFLDLPYNKLLFPVWNGDTVRLSPELEREIPIDTNLLKLDILEIRYNRDMDRSMGIFDREEAYKILLLTKQLALNNLRKTYKTGEWVQMNEFMGNSVNPFDWNEGYVSPLNVLLFYGLKYDKNTNSMLYGDLYNLNAFDYFLPGKPFMIRGSIPLDKKKNGGFLFPNLAFSHKFEK